jgi:hypothetical protein
VRRIALATLFLVALAAQANAQACRNYSQATRQAIGREVEALYDVEVLILHRLMGGHYPAFYDLARRARALSDVIYSESGAIEEQRTRRCRNWVPPIRRTCRDAAERLAEIIDASALRRSSDETRLDYARLIARCEMWLAVPRRSSLLRMP